MATTSPPAAAPPAEEIANPFANDSLAGERAIPIRPGDLVRLLLAEPDLSPVERLELGRLAKMLGSVFHHEFHSWLVELKDLYAPFDPDSDCVDLERHSAKITESADEAFLKPFESALLRANYRPLKMQVIEEAISAPNEQGLTYTPDFRLFEHLKVWVRGSTRVPRTVRNLKTRFRKREIVHDGYQRFAVAMKFRKGMDLGDYVRSDVIYLRLFKDVPHVDMEMHLPEQGTKVRMRMIDKAQIASPFYTGLPALAMKMLNLSFAVVTQHPVVLVGLLVAPFSLAVNSFFGFQRARHKHLAKMIRHLYYLTLANNASVITRMVDSAEEEEFKEALLGYFCLWRACDDGEAWDAKRLDRCIESFVKERTGMEIDFEIGDALGKLTRLGLVQTDGRDRLSAVPIEQALVILDQQWDDIFRYSNGAKQVEDDEAP